MSILNGSISRGRNGQGNNYSYNSLKNFSVTEFQMGINNGNLIDCFIDDTVEKNQVVLQNFKTVLFVTKFSK